MRSILVVAALLVAGIVTADSANTPIKMGDVEMKYTLTVKGNQAEGWLPALHYAPWRRRRTESGQ